MKTRIPWARVREDYESGLITNDAELAKRYGCSPATIVWRRGEDKTQGRPWIRRAPGETRSEPITVDGAAAVPAGQAKHLQPVPDAALGLPWVKSPRDPQTARSLAAALEDFAAHPVVKMLGPEAVAHVASDAKMLRALAERLERADPEGGKVEGVAPRKRLPKMLGIA